MASHVIVIDSSARRTTIKATPSSLLIDILQQACEKLGRDSDAYILKHNSKALDLSLTFRLSGLVNGTKLELVLSSRSPSVVSVALQFSDSKSGEQIRLTSRVPSNTSLWMLLRHFESSEAAKSINFTARYGSATANAGTSLFYEVPVMRVANREYSSFTDLQKTLAQSGVNSGNVLIHLSFRTTDMHFEDAKRQINHYFASTPTPGREATTTMVEAPSAENVCQQTGPITLVSATTLPIIPPSLEGPQSDQTGSTAVDLTSVESSFTSSAPLDKPSDRGVTVWAAPTRDTSRQLQQAFSETDFVPSMDHARSHQVRLSSAGTNKRLLSNAEIDAQADHERRRFESVHEVEIKFRFPDQMLSVTKFQRADTAKSAYDFVRALLSNENEPFILKYASPDGVKTVPRDDGRHLKLISDLKMQGRVLVNVMWDEGASMEARSSPALKEIYRNQACELEATTPQNGVSEHEKELQELESKAIDRGKKNGVPKWLKLPGKR